MGCFLFAGALTKAKDYGKIFMPTDKTDKNGDLHDGNSGRYKSKSAAEMSKENAVSLKNEVLTVVDPRDILEKPLTFTDSKSVEDFFFYDDKKSGLLYKKNSSHGKWEQRLTPNQRYTLSDYAADGYSNINSFLRGYDNGNSYSVDFVKRQITDLDKAIADYELREPIITYRSINSTAFSEFLDDMSKLVGTEYSDPAFMSTSPTLDSSRGVQTCRT